MYGGFFIGSIIEYLVSLIGELIFHIKWWDYSAFPFNIQGRICVAFSFFWGVLAIFLMTYFNPKIDKFIDKIPKKYVKLLAITGIIILIIDAIITGFALRMFFTRIANNYDLELQGVNEYILDYSKLYENPTIKYITDTFFSDEKMLKTLPNIKVMDKDGNIIYVCDIFKDITPYYFKLFTPKI